MRYSRPAFVMNNYLEYTRSKTGVVIFGNLEILRMIKAVFSCIVTYTRPIY